MKTRNVFLTKAVITHDPLLVSGLVFNILVNCHFHFHEAVLGETYFKSLWYKETQSACEYFMTPVHWEGEICLEVNCSIMKINKECPEESMSPGEASEL